jgi:hypothetical protein
MAAELKHLKAQTKRVHAKTKDAVHVKLTPWHGIWSDMLKVICRSVYFKNFCPQLQVTGLQDKKNDPRKGPTSITATLMVLWFDPHPRVPWQLCRRRGKIWRASEEIIKDDTH